MGNRMRPSRPILRPRLKEIWQKTKCCRTYAAPCTRQDVNGISRDICAVTFSAAVQDHGQRHRLAKKEKLFSGKVKKLDLMIII
jgi:hypothetical protein